MAFMVTSFLTTPKFYHLYSLVHELLLNHLSRPIKAELGWKATRGVDEMCADLWRWQSANPNGYAAASE